MSREKEELEKLAKQQDEEKRKKLEALARGTSEEAQLALLKEEHIAAEANKQQDLKDQEQQQSQKPRPVWTTQNRANLALGFGQTKFDEQKFLQTLSSMGINMTKASGIYQYRYGNNNQIDFDASKGLIATNDFSKEGFRNLAQITQASGAKSIDFSEIARVQANNPDLNKILSNAYQMAQEHGLKVLGLGEKEEFIKNFDAQTSQAASSKK